METSTAVPRVDRVHSWWWSLKQRWAENPHRVVYLWLVAAGRVAGNVAVATACGLALWWVYESVTWGWHCRWISETTTLGRLGRWLFSYDVECRFFEYHSYGSSWRHMVVETPFWATFGRWVFVVGLGIGLVVAVGLVIEAWIWLKRRAGVA
jgi:hypothetical protein